jgi:hypothetical protein
MGHYSRKGLVVGTVAHFQGAVMMEVDQAAKAMKDAEIEAEIEDFLEGFNQPDLARHAGHWGTGCRSGRAGTAGAGYKDGFTCSRPLTTP